MNKSVSFRRILTAVIASILFFSAVLLVVYTSVAPRVFAIGKLRELLPRAQYLAEQTALHFNVGDPANVEALGVDSRQWGASVYVYNDTPTMIASTEPHLGQYAYPVDYAQFDAILLDVLSGMEIAETRHIQRAPGEQTGTMELLIIGIPVVVDGVVRGAVVMTQSLQEITSAMSSLLAALWFTMLAVLAMILPLAYLSSRRITKPILQMRDVALRMAAGDFTIRGDDMYKGEMGDLARAMNYISAELRRAIADLMHERNQALAIVNALSEGVLVVDSALAPVQTNPALQAMLDPMDDGPMRHLPPEVIQDFRTALSEGRPVSRDFPLGPLLLSLTVTPVGDERGGPAGAIGVFRDHTQAFRLEQTRREYVANVSHELRTPLTALRAMIEPLRDGLIHTNAQRRETYDIILRETMRLSRLVDDMLELSRLQRGTLALEKMRLDITPLLNDTASIFDAKTKTTGHILTLELPPEPLPTVLCNPDRTEQVLVALLNNAFIYTPSGCTIILRAEALPEFLRVTVEDNGPGIAAIDLPHVFERFYKADKSRSGFSGTGLGLAIARELMENLGESLTVENCETGGARFSFTVHYA